MRACVPACLRACVPVRGCVELLLELGPLPSESASEYSASDCRNRCSLLVCQWLTPPGGAAPEVPPQGVMRSRCRRACNGPFHPPGSQEPVAFLSCSLPLHFFLALFLSRATALPPPGGEPDPAPPRGGVSHWQTRSEQWFRQSLRQYSHALSHGTRQLCNINCINESSNIIVLEHNRIRIRIPLSSNDFDK